MSNVDRIIRASHSELAFEFVRSSGPGGQNVNKVSTAAQLRFDINASSALPEEAKTRLMRIAGRRVTGDGILLIDAKRHRTQDQNRDDAIARFDALLRRALEPPKRRLPTKATAASREERLQSKKRKGEIKKSRQSHGDEV
jgi:ribosome-associated protein